MYTFIVKNIGRFCFMVSVCCLLGLGVASSALAGGLVDNEDGTVTDTNTGLMWSKTAHPFGGVPVPWSTAESQAPSFSAGGKTGWRVATKSELQQLFQNMSGAENPFTNLTDMGGNVHWTSTDISGHKAEEYHSCYVIDMTKGRVISIGRDKAYAYIWPVRRAN
ncbi:MAG: DUF1566 domain-containing protein [Pseudodesulfovibrio sp.]|nr:DUF1566 domain-containing protein [Pseudodesulfovibrio sp.]